jgi:hypothetical protein
MESFWMRYSTGIDSYINISEFILHSSNEWKCVLCKKIWLFVFTLFCDSFKFKLSELTATFLKAKKTNQGLDLIGSILCHISTWFYGYVRFTWGAMDWGIIDGAQMSGRSWRGAEDIESPDDRAEAECWIQKSLTFWNMWWTRMYTLWFMTYIYVLIFSYRYHRWCYLLFCYSSTAKTLVPTTGVSLKRSYEKFLSD